jgi:hypothetical protein
MKTHGEWGRAPPFLNSWKWVVSFTPRQIYPLVRSPRYPLCRKLGGSQSRSGRRVFGAVNELLTSTLTFLQSHHRHNHHHHLANRMGQFLTSSGLIRLVISSEIFPISLTTSYGFLIVSLVCIFAFCRIVLVLYSTISVIRPCASPTRPVIRHQAPDRCPRPCAGFYRQQRLTCVQLSFTNWFI